MSLVLLVAGCGQMADDSGGVEPKPTRTSTVTAEVEGLDGKPAASKVFSAQELLPMLLQSEGGHPGTIGQFGTGTAPEKGEMGADCPAGAKDIVAELYRMKAPSAVQFMAPHAPGEAPASGPVEQLVAMPRDQAARYMALERAKAVACPQTTVSAVGSKPIAPQTLRFRQIKAALGDESFVGEITTWNGGRDTPSAKPNDGDRTYQCVIRMGGVIVMYGEFPTEAAALAGGAKAAAYARPGLLRAAGS